MSPGVAFCFGLAFVFSNVRTAISDDPMCYSCASPILKSQWQATGLPKPPTVENFAFIDSCGKNDGTKPKAPCPSSICIEMLVVANGVYSVVRGCLRDFFPSDIPAPSGNLECLYAETMQNTTLLDDNNKVQFVEKAHVGMSLCKMTSGSTTPCNNDLVVHLNMALGKTAEGKSSSFNWPEQCRIPASFVQCLNCMRYDMSGTCDWNVRTYCQGAWCTKSIGYVNGRWMEVRGCSHFSPVNNQVCTKIERPSELSLSGQTQVPQYISMEQCYCQGQYCNGANTGRMAGMIGAGVALLLPTIFTITSGLM